MTARYRFGGVEFDAATGALRPLGRRLPRQPARLLELLIEKRGEVLSRREIRDELWSDTNVEFDRSLHFCVHQVRTALGDSASEPRFVETIPRRGYRLIPKVERVEAASPEGAAEPAAAAAGAPAPGGRFSRLLPVGLGVAAVLVLGVLALVAGAFRDVPRGAPEGETESGELSESPQPAAEARLRIGVMPFEPPADWPHRAVPEIAEWILEELTLAGANQAWIVGPSTTSAYAGRTLAELSADYELDFIVNGRFLADADPPAMLAELIRAADGAHVWVERIDRIDRLEDARRLGYEISAAVGERLLGAAPANPAPPPPAAESRMAPDDLREKLP